MIDYIESQREVDRSNYAQQNFLGRSRIFKNYINNNSNILRMFKQQEKLTVMKQLEAQEHKIQLKNNILNEKP